MAQQRPRPPSDPGRPNPREVIAKARAEAAPRVAKAVEAAGPKVEKAAERTGKLLGTLRERAKDTARQFSEGYKGEMPGNQAPDERTPGDPASRDQASGGRHEQPKRPRPRPHR
jgi:hypothetical protein